MKFWFVIQLAILMVVSSCRSSSDQSELAATPGSQQQNQAQNHDFATFNRDLDRHLDKTCFHLARIAEKTKTTDCDRVLTAAICGAPGHRLDHRVNALLADAALNHLQHHQDLKALLASEVEDTFRALAWQCLQSDNGDKNDASPQTANTDNFGENSHFWDDYLSQNFDNHTKKRLAPITHVLGNVITETISRDSCLFTVGEIFLAMQELGLADDKTGLSCVQSLQDDNSACFAQLNKNVCRSNSAQRRIGDEDTFLQEISSSQRQMILHHGVINSCFIDNDLKLCAMLQKLSQQSHEEVASQANLFDNVCRDRMALNRCLNLLTKQSAKPENDDAPIREKVTMASNQGVIWQRNCCHCRARYYDKNDAEIGSHNVVFASRSDSKCAKWDDKTLPFSNARFFHRGITDSCRSVKVWSTQCQFSTPWGQRNRWLIEPEEKKIISPPLILPVADPSAPEFVRSLRGAEVYIEP